MTEPSVGFSLREHVTPQDRTKLFDLLNAGGYFSPREIAFGLQLFDEHLFRGSASSYQFMLYEQDAGLLACGCFGALPLTDRRFHLHWLAVLPHYHGKGVGQRLEAAIVTRVRLQGGVRIYAEISHRDYHERARAFYQHCGYEESAVVKDYYAKGDDKVLYAKNL